MRTRIIRRAAMVLPNYSDRMLSGQQSLIDRNQSLLDLTANMGSVARARDRVTIV